MYKPYKRKLLFASQIDQKAERLDVINTIKCLELNIHESLLKQQLLIILQFDLQESNIYFLQFSRSRTGGKRSRSISFIATRDFI